MRINHNLQVSFVFIFGVLIEPNALGHCNRKTNLRVSGESRRSQLFS